MVSSCQGRTLSRPSGCSSLRGNPNTSLKSCGLDEKYAESMCLLNSFILSVPYPICNHMIPQHLVIRPADILGHGILTTFHLCSRCAVHASSRVLHWNHALTPAQLGLVCKQHMCVLCLLLDAAAAGRIRTSSSSSFRFFSRNSGNWQRPRWYSSTL